ncbi:MAG TPA: glycosyltransferase family 39 protein, partial [Anaerolineaceae bacterium]
MIRKANVLLLLLLGLAALAGMVLVAYATARGAGVGGDATIYLTSARNLIAGKGLGWTEADGSFRLLPYSPPFYPLVLGIVGLLARNMLAGARWLNVLLFGLTIALVGWFFFRATRRVWLAVVLSAVLAVSPVILGVQVWAMTESIFLLLGFAGLLALLAFLDRPRGWVLALSALLTGLAFLTRYIGVAYVATACLALLLFGSEDDRRIRLRWQNLRTAILYGVAAIFPILVWLVIDFSLTGTVGSRSGQPAAAYWQRFLEMGPALQQIYLFWLLPDSYIARLPGLVKLATWLVPLGLVAALAVVLARRASAAPRDTGVGKPAGASAVRLAGVFGLFVLVYLITLAIVQVFTYPPITLASRMLSPVHLAALVLIFVLLHLSLNLLVPGSRAAVGLVYLGCFALLGVYGL